MDLAHLILDTARAMHEKDIRDQCVTIQVVHSLFNSHSCSQWIRIYQDKDVDGDIGLVVVHKWTRLRFRSLSAFLEDGADLVLQMMMHDFMDVMDTDILTDMDYIAMHVYYEKRRLSILHSYISSHISLDVICDMSRWSCCKSTDNLRASFKRQVIFGCNTLGG